MSSPCVICKSFPCACPRVNLHEGRYSFTVDPTNQYDGTTDASVDNSPPYCILCHCSPCICYRPEIDLAYIMNCGCILGFCKCSEEEPRELHDYDNWQHRSTHMRCLTCMWWVQKGVKADEMLANIGRCRKHAPTLDGWPAVYETDWCGDHKLDETKLK